MRGGECKGLLLPFRTDIAQFLSEDKLPFLAHEPHLHVACCCSLHPKRSLITLAATDQHRLLPEARLAFFPLAFDPERRVSVERLTIVSDEVGAPEHLPVGRGDGECGARRHAFKERLAVKTRDLDVAKLDVRVPARQANRPVQDRLFRINGIQDQLVVEPDLIAGAFAAHTHAIPAFLLNHTRHVFAKGSPGLFEAMLAVLPPAHIGPVEPSFTGHPEQHDKSLRAIKLASFELHVVVAPFLVAKHQPLIRDAPGAFHRVLLYHPPATACGFQGGIEHHVSP